MKSSTRLTKEQARELERAARELLGIPKLPDGANGPRSRAALAQILADEATMGKEATLRKWAKNSTVAHAFTLDTDPDEHKQASKRTVADYEHPTRKGEYHYPLSRALEEALSNTEKRSKCSSSSLAKLDKHQKDAVELEEDWHNRKAR